MTPDDATSPRHAGPIRWPARRWLGVAIAVLGLVALTLQFSAYLQANGDVAQAGLNPMQHYLQYGLVENRTVLNDGTFGAGLIG